ncbi:bacillithiol system redox-active protein YtxJ [Flavobacteriaceae bacterium F08102]|nr:bacillithiol system redox-active protein YtxJ [Flavobacteriaceae bacterium F08102]
MGILKKLFGEQKQPAQTPSHWVVLDELAQLETIREKSHEKLQLIFKHSRTCGISRGVIKQFEKSIDPDKATYYYLDLLSYRAISNAIAEQFGVRHESPQLLVIKDGKVIAHDSHYEIVNLAY